jgi:DNA-binding helix-hairpin-helix protein with protein kinase domain
VRGKPDLVAKVYHTALGTEKAEKISAMVGAASSELQRFAAWPMATVHLAPGGPVVGFVMPRVSGYKDIHLLWVPAARETEFPHATWAFLVHAARNCATAFHSIHTHGYVIGDVNEKNLVVSDRAMVHLIDCDSFQVSSRGRVWRCEVAVPTFMPPELHGKDLRQVSRSPDHDAFGLAVLVFLLLFMGRHPFAGAYRGRGEMPINRAIRESRFAYGARAPLVQMTPPPFSLQLEELPADLSRLFERAFCAAGTSQGLRPRPSEWVTTLTSLESSLTKCRADQNHLFYSGASGCPWCRVYKEGGPVFFVIASVAPSFLDAGGKGAEADSVWRRIEAAGTPTFRLPSVPSAATGGSMARRLPGTATTSKAVAGVCRAFMWLSAGMFVVGILWPPLLLASIGSLIIFGIATQVAAQGHRAEAALRRRAHDATEARLEEGAAKFRAESLECSQDFERVLNDAKGLHRRLKNLRAEHDSEVARLRSDKRTAQLELWLRRFLLVEHRIPKIGPVRLATLTSYGIETAAEVQEARIARIPGFGPGLIEVLLDWRASLQKRFRVDPREAMPANQIRALELKYGQLHASLLAQLRDVPAKQLALSRRWETRIRELSAAWERAHREHAQAELDMTVL